MFFLDEKIMAWAKSVSRRLRRLERPRGGIARKPEMWDGVIVDAGPDGEEDYTDHRYWVARAWGKNTTGDETTAAEYEGLPADLPVSGNVTLLSGATKQARIVTATNLAELMIGADEDEPNLGSHMLPVGTPVRVATVWDRQTPNRRRYVIRATSPHLLFPVKVEMTGGSAGDETTQCTFTYTVTSIYGIELGTGMSPLKRRPALGKMSEPEDDDYGTGFFDENGQFQLWDANETLRVETCPE